MRRRIHRARAGSRFFIRWEPYGTAGRAAATVLELRSVSALSPGVGAIGVSDSMRSGGAGSIPSRVRATSSTVSVERLDAASVQVVTRVSVEIDGGSKPACVAETVSRMYFAG